MFKTLFLAVQTAFLSGTILANVPNQKYEPRYNATLWQHAMSTYDPLIPFQQKANLDTYAAVYFSNLERNFGYNTHGTCSYIAIGMLLSFYDTYFNDNIILPRYEKRAEIKEGYDFTVISRDTKSPGIYSEPFNDVYGLSKSQYISYVQTHANDYFHMHLINNALTTWGTNVFDVESRPFGLSVAQEKTLIMNYLNNERNLSGYSVTTLPFGTSQGRIYDETINRITNGKPVILNVVSSMFGRHAVVAYDYDDENIYVHTGWKANEGFGLARASLNDLAVTQVESLVAINIPSGCGTATDNYYYMNKDDDDYGVDVTAIAKVEDVCLEAPVSSYVGPVLKWKCLSDERFFESPITVDVKIMNPDTNFVYQGYGTKGKSIRLSRELWDTLVDSNGHYDFKVQFYIYFIDRSYNATHYQEDFYLNDRLDETISYLDYNYPNSYTTYNNYQDKCNSNGYEFKTKGKNVSVSPSTHQMIIQTKSPTTNEGYIEYYFPHGIEEMTLDISYYSTTDGSSYFNGNNGSKLVLQEFKGGKYNDVFDFTTKVNAICSGFSYKTRRTIKFERTTFKVRIYANSGPIDPNASSTNKGRICIGDVTVKKNRNNILPCNGYEFEYDPHFGETSYGSNDFSYYNCYAYGLNVKDFGYIQPGYITTNEQEYRSLFVTPQEGVTYDYNYYQDPLKTIAYLAGHDARCDDFSTSEKEGLYLFGYRFEEIDADTPAADGCYKVALIMQENFGPYRDDYHWLRQNDDGTWSHKPGPDKPTNFDSSENIIYHPETATVGYGIYYNANKGIKFFQVSRKKNVYTGGFPRIKFSDYLILR